MILRFLCGESVRFGNFRFVGIFSNGIFHAFRVLTERRAYTKFNWIPDELAASNGKRKIGVCRSNYVLCMPISSVNRKSREVSITRCQEDFALEKKSNWSISSFISHGTYLHRWWMCDIACWRWSWWATGNHSIGCVHRKNSSMCARALARKNTYYY